MLYVIIPCYKSKDTLDRTLCSLQAQTNKKFKVVLAIDADGETYNNFLSKYCDLDMNILYFDKNLGPGMTRQRAMDRCDDAEYYMFVDSDDMLNPLAIEILLKSIEETNSDLIISNIERFNENGDIVHFNINNPNHHVLTWCHGKIYKRSFLIKNNIRFSENLRVNEDVYFNTMVYELSDKHFNVDEYTYIWFYRKGSLTNKRDKEQLLENNLCSTKAIIDSMIELNDKKDELTIDFVAHRLVLLYEIYEEAKHNKLNLDVLKLEYNKLKEQLDCKEFIQENINNCKKYIQTTGVFDDGFYYYTETFVDFINNNF